MDGLVLLGLLLVLGLPKISQVQVELFCLWFSIFAARLRLHFSYAATVFCALVFKSDTRIFIRNSSFI